MNDFLRILIALVLPPLGVYLEVGMTKHFFINIILLICGWLPAIIHALYIITTRDGSVDVTR